MNFVYQVLINLENHYLKVKIEILEKLNYLIKLKKHFGLIE